MSPGGVGLFGERVATFAVMDVEQTPGAWFVVRPVDHAERAFSVADVVELADGGVSESVRNSSFAVIEVLLVVWLLERGCGMAR